MLLSAIIAERKEIISMKPFSRIFKYVWPQWHRLVVIVVTAMLIAALFSLSFMTVIPLLKVMMNEEGLHSWVDRTVCNWRYGVEFYVPNTLADSSQDTANYLRITKVKKGSLAEAAGLAPEDRIVGAGKFLIREGAEKVGSVKLLEELATTGESTITVQLQQLNKEGNLEDKQVPLNTGVKTTFINIAQWAVGFLPREETGSTKEHAVTFIILLMVAATIIRCTARFYQSYLAEKVVQVAVARLREDAFAHVMEMPVGFFSSEGTSDTTSRLLGDISATGKGVKILLGKALREPLKAISCLAGAMWISYKLTLIFLCCAPLTVVFVVLLGRKIKKATKRSLMSTARMLGKLQGAIGALRVVKVYNRQKHEHQAYQGINRRFLRQVLRVAKVNAGTGPILESLGMIGGSAALLFGIHWMVTTGEMRPSSFFGLIFLLGTSAESVRRVSDVWNKVQQANAASERVFAVIDEPAEFEKPGAIELGPLKEKIEFRDVIFTYPKSNKPVLNRINLTVKAGETVALVGPNGAGKTTLVNLIPRFYNIDSGSILIDGQDARDCTLRSLREQIGMVTQDVMTFNDTVAANIGYGKADATMAEIIAAAKRSFAHEFIEELPEGYDSTIGEHGSKFSGGQLQRIVIARAILKNPSILILDEAMSQVDADSEAKIHKALSELMHNRTCFVIAHRFSTVISADTIVVMDDGQIMAQGKHEELFQSCSVYRNLYETQLIIPDEAAN